MNKKLLALLLTLCMVFTVLPVTAQADNMYDEKETFVTSYEELVAALADEEMQYIYISDMGTYADESVEFTWPEGDVTLDLKSANTNCEIWLGRDVWEIPENVTVNAYQTLKIGAPDGEVVINGTWNIMKNFAVIGGVSGRDAETGEVIGYGKVTLNGTMTVDKDVWTVQPVSGQFTINGTLSNDCKGYCVLNDVTLGDGAVIKGSEAVKLKGDLVSQGHASVETQLSIDTSSSTPADSTISGDLDISRIYMLNGEVTIAQGSTVTLHNLTLDPTDYDDRYATMNVNGTVILDKEQSGGNGSYRVSGSSVVLGEDGELILMPFVRVYGEDDTISGDGTLKLYARMNSQESGNGETYTYFTDHPQLFDSWTDDWDTDGIPAWIADTVTVWRNWNADENTCSHNWGESYTVEATCAAQGYTAQICDDCGTEWRSDIVRPTGEHKDFTYEKSGDTAIRQSCGNCDSSWLLWFYADNGTYTGEPVKTAYFGGSWQGEYPEIVYTNNVEKGTATASATVEGITISVTFEIVECAHTGGTATCTKRAVCTSCGNEYGELANHTAPESLKCGDQPVCTVCGQPYGEALEHEYDVGNPEYDISGHWYVCEKCGEILPEDIISMELGIEPGFSHFFENSTCADADWCKVCGYYKPAGGHYGGTATCKTLAVCEGCGTSYGTLADHSYGEWTQVKAPTEAAEGQEKRTCTVCGKEETRAIDKLPSSKPTEPSTDPTTPPTDPTTPSTDPTTPSEPTTSENPFTDVKEGKFYFDAVRWAVENGITKGVTDTTFVPSKGCSRGEVVTFLYRAAGEPEVKTTENPFTDVSEKKFYYKAVMWAVENGITKGTSDTTFDPGKTCTRGEVATFLYRASEDQDYDTTKANPFNDAVSGKFYYEAVQWASQNGITTGVTTTTFVPAKDCNRGEIVTFLYRAQG